MRILLAVDGSDQSYEATRALAHLRKAEQVFVLHVLDVPEPAYPTMVPEAARDLYATVERAMREDGERLLKRPSSLLPMNTGPVTTRLEVGRPADVILSAAQEERIDLILVGARGVSPIRELVLGSVSHRLITYASCPTLIVSTPLRALRHLLLPLEGQYDAERAVRFLQTKPFREAMEVTLLKVVPFGQPPWPVSVQVAESMEKEALEHARDFLDEVASRLSALDCRAKTVAMVGTPAVAILQEAAKLKPDLILMGSSGRRGVTRFVLGSVAHAVVHRTPCSVLVFR